MSKKHKKHKATQKRKGSVKLPKDREGNYIEPGSWMMFDEGPFHVESLLWDSVGWMAYDEKGDYSDNLGNGRIIG